MVKYRGTQPRAKKMFRTPERRETSEGLAIVERMTEPMVRMLVSFYVLGQVTGEETYCNMRLDLSPSTRGSWVARNTCTIDG